MPQASAGPASVDARSGAAVPERPSRARAWRDAYGLRTYLTLTYSTGVLLAVAMVLQTDGLEVEPWALLAVVALSLFADLPLIETRIGHSVESFTFSELCIILSLVLLPLPYAVVIAATCVFVFDIGRRIQLPRAAFNASNVGIATAVAGWVAHRVTPDALSSGSPSSLFALLIATFVFFLVNSGGVALAVALSQQASFRAMYRHGLEMRLALAGLNGLIAVLIVVLAQRSPGTLFLLPPALAAMFGSYRGYLHARQERDVWQQLESATRELTSLDLDAVVGAALSRSAQLFKADSVSVVLDDGSGSTVYTGDASGLLETSTELDGKRSQRTGGFESDDGSLMVYAAPLEGPQGRLGVLRLGFRGPVQLRHRERQVLKTLAHSISTTLQNARLYGEMRTHAEAMAFEASHDALTGLGNRSLLQDRSVATMAAASRSGTQCALLIVDLDHFKEINDTLGHAAGDVLLTQVAHRIAQAAPQADAVCRLGGDEFAVLLGGFSTAEDADVLAGRLLEVLAEPVVFDGLRLSIEGSVGIACHPQDASSFDELLKRADVALYQAKDTRGSYAHYSGERDESSLHRLALAAELRAALADDQLVVHFQPQVDLQSGALTGAEALVRWEHPVRGLLAPGEFISAVEHSGLIRDFTLTVLDKATAEAAAWGRAGHALSVAVNLSARNLLDRELPSDVARVLARHGLPPERLVLEITETTMMSELDVVEDVLARLRGLHIELSVDDFGTGYSSLAFLQRVQVNEVKVDRSFVMGAAASGSDRALVRATVQLAHSLGARAVGEGVEDAVTAAVLRDLGCDLAQGYHLGRPMPASDLRRQLGMVERRRGQPGHQDVEGRHLRAVGGPR